MILPRPATILTLLTRFTLSPGPPTACALCPRRSGRHGQRLSLGLILGRLDVRISVP